MSSAGSYGAGGGGGVGNVKFLEGNTGGAVGPTLAGIINVVGAGDITVAGNAGTNTLTISLTGGVATTYDADSGSATPVLGILNINGASGLQTTAAGNTIIIETNGDIAITYDCDNSTSATPSGGILNITGGTSGAIFTGAGNTITESFSFLAMSDTTSTTGYVSIGGSKVMQCGGGAGSGNFFAGQGAGNTTVSGTGNVGIGNISLDHLTTALANTALGAGSATGITSGGQNVALGHNSLFSATTDAANVAVGASALDTLNTSSGGNTGVGYQSLMLLATGTKNIALGYNSGQSYTTSESSNILIGNIGAAAESNQIRIGTQGAGTGQQNACNIAGIFGSTVGGTNAVVFIDNTGQLGTTGGTFPSLGTTNHAVQVGNVSGNLTSLGVGSNGQVLVGSTGANPAFATLTSSGGTLTYTTGAASLNIDVTAPLAIAYGGTNATSMTNTDGVVYYDGTRLVTTAVGTAGQILTSNGAGVAPTFQASSGGVTSITGNGGGGAVTGAVTLTGGTSGAIFTGSGGNTQTESFHFLTMSDSSATTGYIQIGTTRVFNCGAGVAGHNTFVGQNAGNSTLTGTQNVCIGDGPGASGAGAVLTTGNLNTSCGYGSFNNLGSGFQNTAFGGTALENVTTGHNNTACGQGALIDITTGSNNTGLGYAAGSSYITGSEANNLCVGANVTGVNGESNTIRLGDIASATACYVAGTYGQSVGGTNATLFIDNTGKIGTVGGSGSGVTSLNTLTGALTLTGGTSGAIFTNSGGNTITESFNFLAMADTTATTGYISLGGTKVLQAGGGVANNNIFVGESAGNTTLSGTGNAGLGASVMAALTTGSNNVAIGRVALTAGTTGSGNVCVGPQTMQFATTSGQNVAVGFQALQQITTGTGENVAVGASTMSFLGTGTANVAIGLQSGFNYNGAESNNILISNQGVNAESGVIRVGTNGTHTTCFVQGIAGVTVANTAAVLINTTNGQLGTVISSRRFKENIDDMGSASRSIYKLRPVRFNFKGDFNESYGLIAEDVEEVMPYLVSYDKEGLPATVKYHELPSLLLNEIQRLKLKIDELEGKLNARVR